MNASYPPGTGLWEETMGSSSDGFSFFDLDSFINLDGSTTTTTTTTDSMSTDDVEHRNMFRLSIDGNSSSNMANNDNDTGTSPPTSYGSDEQTVVVCVPVNGGAVDQDEDARLDPFGNEVPGTAQQQQFYQQKQAKPQLELHRQRHPSSPSRSLEVAASVSDSEILRLEDLSVRSPRRPVAAAHVPASAPASRRGSPTKLSSSGGRLTSMCSRIYEKAATTLARPSRSPVKRTQTEHKHEHGEVSAFPLSPPSSDHHHHYGPGQTSFVADRASLDDPFGDAGGLQQQQQHIKQEEHHSHNHHQHQHNNHTVLPETPVATPLLGHETVADVADEASRDALAAAAASSGWAAGQQLWTGAQFEVQQGQQLWDGLSSDRSLQQQQQQHTALPPPPGTVAARRRGHGGGPTVSLSQLDLSGSGGGGGGGGGGSNSLMIQMPQPRGPPHASVQQRPESQSQSQYPLPPDGGDLACHYTATATYQPPGPSTAPMPAPADGASTGQQQQQQQQQRVGTASSTHLYRRPKPRAPSSGARHRNGAPAAPPLTSPRKASSGPRSTTSPSPGLRATSHQQQQRRSASMQSLRDAAVSQPGAVRKRRSFTTARQTSISCGQEAVAAAAAAAAAAASFTSSCSPSRVPRKALSTNNLTADRGVPFAAAGPPSPPPPPPGSFGFVNYTAQDHDVLMAGVAPSGSAKTKARRERETYETIERERQRQRVLADALSAVGADVSVLKYEGIAI